MQMSSLYTIEKKMGSVSQTNIFVLQNVTVKIRAKDLVKKLF